LNVAIGDFVKSWDVLETIRFLQDHVAKDLPVLDIGAYASEIVVALHKLGYRDISGADLDPRLAQMPHLNAIRYQVCNFMETPFEDDSFEAITAISVIEHGYDGDALFREVERLLRPGGFFVASFDYWRSKIKTDGIKFFGMSWMIFSEADVGRMVECAGLRGLHPVGELDFNGSEKPINCGGRDYTFGWIVLQKDPAA